jgi:hypothetical protein
MPGVRLLRITSVLCNVETMKLKLAALIVLTSCAYAVNAQERSSGSEQVLTRLRRELWLAATRVDLQAVDRIVSDDYLETESDGSVSSKADLIEAIREFAGVPPHLLPPPPALDDIKVRFYGDAAVLTGRSSIKLKDVEQYRITEVYVRQKGQWRLVSSQSTRIARQ